MDFAHARYLMVETQVRPSDVTDLSILAAMRAIPREAFAPAALKQVAYADRELEVAPGRALMRPRDLGKLIQALAPRPGARALEIAGATGYGAAVLAKCGAQTTLLEPDPDLNFAAVAALGACGVDNVDTASTDITAGWADAAPYDIIMLNGSAETVPEAWLAQLAEGGRLGVIVRSGAAGHARLYTKSGGVTAFRVLFDAAPPVAPGLAAKPQFAF
ncbi:MAG: protein-L-isoaspartate O-methyltransferase [Hyphomonadaceae bacterium]|nr:protein-L-isoaspartate O-methyltransferase [Hyphomonadaceae bacterium]